MNELSYLSVFGKPDISEQNILTAASSRRKYTKGEFLHAEVKVRMAKTVSSALFGSTKK